MQTPSKPLVEIWNEIELWRQRNLASKGVQPLPKFKEDKPCCKHLGLILMYVNMGHPVDKDQAGNWIAEAAAACDVKCRADVQSIRAWPREHGWPIYSGDKGGLDPFGKPLNRSDYCMYGTNPPKEWTLRQTRSGGRMACATFEEICAWHDFRCVMCKNGGLDKAGTPRIKLEQGHMDPRLPLSLSNTVPVCEECNKFQLDSFAIDERGRLTTILPSQSSIRFFKNLKPAERQQLSEILRA